MCICKLENLSRKMAKINDRGRAMTGEETGREVIVLCNLNEICPKLKLEGSTTKLTAWLQAMSEMEIGKNLNVVLLELPFEDEQISTDSQKYVFLSDEELEFFEEEAA